MKNLEVWMIVMTRYPKTESEMRCKVEREMMQRLRNYYYEKLINERKSEGNILAEGGEVA